VSLRLFGLHLACSEMEAEEKGESFYYGSKLSLPMLWKDDDP